jgi:hypothetical protein
MVCDGVSAGDQEGRLDRKDGKSAKKAEGLARDRKELKSKITSA